MGGTARHDVHVESMQFVSYLLGGAVCLALLPLYPAPEVGGKLAWYAFGMYFVVGVLNYLLNIAMAAGMKRGPNSTLYSMTILHEKETWHSARGPLFAFSQMKQGSVFRML